MGRLSTSHFRLNPCVGVRLIRHPYAFILNQVFIKPSRGRYKVKS